jgi:hypothetical protein
MNNWRIKNFYDKEGEIKFMPQENKKFFIFSLWINLFDLSCAYSSERDAYWAIKYIIVSRENKKEANKVLSYIYFRNNSDE